jgi:hypothetical protein
MAIYCIISMGTSDPLTFLHKAFELKIRAEETGQKPGGTVLIPPADTLGKPCSKKRFKLAFMGLRRMPGR